MPRWPSPRQPPWRFTISTKSPTLAAVEMQTQAATSTTDASWAPDSWKSRPAAQQPVYPDPAALQQVLAQLARLPPLVTSWEIENLKQQLAEAVRGGGVFLQGGDLSGRFGDCEAAAVATKR